MLIRLGFSDEQILDYLYLAALSRHPTDAERGALVDALVAAEKEKAAGTGDPRRMAWTDMSWALLTSKEFMFNH
jgi:hypothetical protein